jgi:hypothetical protein
MHFVLADSIERFARQISCLIDLPCYGCACSAVCSLFTLIPYTSKNPNLTFPFCSCADEVLVDWLVDFWVVGLFCWYDCLFFVGLY